MIQAHINNNKVLNYNYCYYFKIQNLLSTRVNMLYFELYFQIYIKS